MAKFYYEDVEVGTEIPTLVKHPTTTQLVKWAGATQDPARIHYDKDYAQRVKLPGQIIHGLLKWQWFIQMLSDWIGDDGNIKKVSCQYRGRDLPGDTIKCKGKVTKKYIKDAHYIECEIWLGNQREERTTSGSAIVTLPSRG